MKYKTGDKYTTMRNITRRVEQDEAIGPAEIDMLIADLCDIQKRKWDEPSEATAQRSLFPVPSEAAEKIANFYGKFSSAKDPQTGEPCHPTLAKLRQAELEKNEAAINAKIAKTDGEEQDSDDDEDSIPF